MSTVPFPWLHHLSAALASGLHHRPDLPPLADDIAPSDNGPGCCYPTCYPRPPGFPGNYVKLLILLERMAGIEPASIAWEATALPLSYTRTRQLLTWPADCEK
jgi:hypothetical protein